MTQWTLGTQFLFQQLFCLIKRFFVAIWIIHQAAEHSLDSGLSKQRLFSLLRGIDVQEYTVVVIQT